mgnify:CR=1 FL=1
MKARYLAIGVASAIACGAAPALADHNSPNEEGWANMPNDIHNTRIDTRESGDNEAFRDFVQYGDGADSVNRFASDDTMPPGVQAQKGNADAAKTQAQAKQMSGTQTQEMKGERTQTKQMGGTETQTQPMGGAKAQTRTQLKDGTGTNSRVKQQRRTRYDPATGSNARRHDRRQGSGKRGGGKG